MCGVCVSNFFNSRNILGIAVRKYIVLSIESFQSMLLIPQDKAGTSGLSGYLTGMKKFSKAKSVAT